MHGWALAVCHSAHACSVLEVSSSARLRSKTLHNKHTLQRQAAPNVDGVHSILALPLSQCQRQKPHRPRATAAGEADYPRSDEGLLLSSPMVLMAYQKSLARLPVISKLDVDETDTLEEKNNIQICFSSATALNLSHSNHISRTTTWTNTTQRNTTPAKKALKFDIPHAFPPRQSFALSTRFALFDFTFLAYTIFGISNGLDWTVGQ
jgi:hypothetical protein